MKPFVFLFGFAKEWKKREKQRNTNDIYDYLKGVTAVLFHSFIKEICHFILCYIFISCVNIYSLHYKNKEKTRNEIIKIYYHHTQLINNNNHFKCRLNTIFSHSIKFGSPNKHCVYIHDDDNDNGYESVWLCVCVCVIKMQWQTF